MIRSFGGANVVNILTYLFVFSVIIFTPIALISVVREISLFNFLHDPATISNISPFAGIFSNLGIILWCSTATICLITWTMLRTRKTNRYLTNIMLSAGIFTLWLMFDDGFLLHELIFPKVLGLSNDYTIAIFAILVLCGLILFRNSIRQTEFSHLIVALVLFAISAYLDTISYFNELWMGDWRILLEDGSKFAGIAN